MPVVFEGRLTFSVDGPGGATAGTVTGDGSTVLVHADDPVAAWDAALGSAVTGPKALDAVAQVLHDEGVVVRVSGPSGVVATVGAGVDSRLGALLAGSRRIRLGSPAAVRPLALAQARRSAGPATRPLVAVALAAIAWLVLRRALGTAVRR